MRSVSYPFSQTKMALFSSNATLMEKFKFRGICFILSLRWLRLKNAGTSDSNCIFGIKDEGQFKQLWTEFTLQSSMATEMMKLKQEELQKMSDKVESLKEGISLTIQSINSLSTDQTDLHIAYRDKLQLLRADKKKWSEVHETRQKQFLSMFADKEELDRGDAGTPSEQLLRKLMEVKSVEILPIDLPVKSKSMFGTTYEWGTAAELFAAWTLGRTTKGLSGSSSTYLFEIGLYGSGAHSIALQMDDTGAYALFDPNYGTWTGDGKSQKLADDMAAFLKDYYPKMNKVVVSWLHVV